MDPPGLTEGSGVEPIPSPDTTNGTAIYAHPIDSKTTPGRSRQSGLAVPDSSCLGLRADGAGIDGSGYGDMGKCH